MLAYEPSYKVALIDLDGCLLSKNNTIPKDNIKAVKAANKLGVDIVLASGRYSPSLDVYAKWLKINNCHLISLNGMVKASKEGPIRKSLWWEYIPKDIVQDVLSFCMRNNPVNEKVYLQYFYHNQATGEEICYALDNRFSRRFARIYAKNSNTKFELLPSFDLLQKENALKLVMLHDNPELMDTINGALLVQGYPDELQIVRTHRGGEPKRPAQLEVMSMSKEQGLRKLAGELGITLDEVIAIGDGDNDVGMIRAAGMGVALQNATEKAKRVAMETGGYITGRTNEQGGVAEALAKYILGAPKTGPVIYTMAPAPKPHKLIARIAHLLRKGRLKT